MRAGSRGVVSQSAFAIVAVTPASKITPVDLEAQFQTLGYMVSPQPRLSRTRADRAPILHVHRTSSTTESTKQAIALIVMASLALSPDSTLTKHSQTAVAPAPASAARLNLLEFQSVWNIQTWSPIGLELFVADDNDAFEQLDALAQGLATNRDQLTIKPRVGWQSYGHPEVQNLG